MTLDALRYDSFFPAGSDDLDPAAGGADLQLVHSMRATVRAAATARACSKRAVQHARAALAVLPMPENDDGDASVLLVQEGVSLEETSSALSQVARAASVEELLQATDMAQDMLGDCASRYQELFDVLRRRTQEVENLRQRLCARGSGPQEGEDSGYTHMVSAVRLSQLPPRLTVSMPPPVIDSGVEVAEDALRSRGSRSSCAAPSDVPTTPPVGAEVYAQLASGGSLAGSCSGRAHSE